MLDTLPRSVTLLVLKSSASEPLVGNLALVELADTAGEAVGTTAAAGCADSHVAVELGRQGWRLPCSETHSVATAEDERLAVEELEVEEPQACKAVRRVEHSDVEFLQVAEAAPAAHRTAATAAAPRWRGIGTVDLSLPSLVGLVVGQYDSLRYVVDATPLERVLA